MSKKLVAEEREHLVTVIKQIKDLINILNEEKQESGDYIQNTVARYRLRKKEDYIISLKSPYFGRLDLQFDDQTDFERFLIGEKSISKSETEELVIDWRSPIGDIFYKYYGGSGKLYYKNELGNRINVLVNRKRNINIKDSDVVSVKEVISDEYSLTANENAELSDSLINDFLSQFGSDLTETYQVKKIVKSIQQEQNEVIRLGIEQPVLIQGVAGSGKTTIALHRLSYLIYQYKNKLRLEKMLILAPNKLFISYIRDILPELELEKIQQSTFVELARRLLPFITEIELPQVYLNQLISRSTNELSNKVHQFKGSMKFRNAVERYLEFIEQNFFVPKQVKLPTFNEKEHINASEEIKKIYEGYRHLPLNKRRSETIKSINSWKEIEINKQIEILKDEAIKTISRWQKPIPESNELHKEVERVIISSTEFQINTLKRKWDSKLSEMINEWEELNAFDIYTNLMETPLLLALSNINEALATKVVDDFYSYGKKNKVRYEDLAPLIFIQEKINGIDLKYDYMMIDEAQDLSPFQISILNSFTTSMTLLGDNTQSIYGELGTQDWREITDKVFLSKCKRLDLTISYRSTFEIMNAANIVLKNSGYTFPSIEPISRHGKEVEYKKVRDGNDLLEQIDRKLKELLSKGYLKIAVISKSMKLSERIFEQFISEGHKNIQLVNNLDDELKENIIFISSELVKGLEFDAVIIPNANHRAYPITMLDTKLLFVSMTRAQEELHIFYYEDPSPLLVHLLKEDPLDKDVLAGLL